MDRPIPPSEKLRAAIEGLSIEDLVGLQLVARRFDPHRYEDLLQEAITRTLSGERKWRDGVAFNWHLHECMRSISWDCSRKRDENLFLDSQSGDGNRDMSVLAGSEAATPDPERQTAARLALERIVENCGSDPVVLGLIKGKLQGKTGPEIREELKLSEKDFRAAAQRLRRSARKVIVRGQRYA
jgi:DNA-directed RNA polymerase specialized sigma24 family protein